MITEIEFKYCPNCGKYFKKIDKTLLICVACGLHYYLNPKSTNAIILKNENDEYLFVKRAFDPKKNWLDLPGGFLNQGETVEESLIREVKEEIGITIEKLKYETSCVDEYEFKNLRSKTVCMIFSGNLPKNYKINPADDVSDFMFFKKESIPFEKIAFDGMRDSLKKILSFS